METVNNRLSIPVRLKYNGNICVDLSNEVLNNPDKSFFIYGKGGTGKTHLFIELFDKLTKDNNSSIVPFYIPLNSVQPDKYKNSIIGELTERLRNPDSEEKLTEQEVDKLLRCEDKKILILADGLNEVTQEDNRRLIAKELSEIASSNTYKNVHIILSSRINHSSWFQSLGLTDYLQMEIQDLNEEDIRKYLSKACSSIKYSDIEIPTKKLLLTAMGLSMYAELVGKDSGSIISFNSLGGLLNAYMCFLLKSADSSIPYEEFLVSVAKEMMKNYSFNIRLSKLKEIGSYSESIKVATESILTTQGTNTNGLTDEYTFSHQNFRDMLVAKSFSEDILNLKENPQKVFQIIQNNYITTNREIFVLVSDFLIGHDDIIQDIINNIPKENVTFQLSKLIELFALINNNSIAKLSLKEHDLSGIRFSGYKLFDAVSNRNLMIENCTVSPQSFSMPGLTMASSTITSYNLNNSVFFIAFCKTSFLIYDVTNSTTFIQLLEKDINDVNCCCNVEINNIPCILLGTDNGIIHLYHTDTKVLEDLTKHNIDKKPICSIVETEQGIFYTQKNSSESCSIYLMHIGTIAVQICTLNISEDFRISNKINETKAMCGAWRIQAKLSSSKKAVYCVYGDKLYCYRNNEFEEIKLNIPEGIIDYKMFIDIAVTESCVFINNVEGILVFCYSETSEEITLSFIKKISIEEYKVKSGKFFTKFSKWLMGDTILIGIGIRQAELRGNINFLMISANCTNKKRKIYDIDVSPIYGKHSKTTYTATCFNVYYDTNPHNYLATVSDDRSVQIIEVGNEDFEPIQLLGEYNGIRSIYAIDESTIICAGYDGCISKWENIKGEWYCSCNSKVHNSWIEKIKFFHISEPERHFVLSASLDGYVKLTDLDKCTSKVLCVKGIPITDIDLSIHNDKITITFITNNTITSLHEYPLNDIIKKFDNKKSISSLIENETLFNTIEFKNEYLSSGKAAIITSSNEIFGLLCPQNKDSEIHYIIDKKYTKIFSCNHYARCISINNEYLILAGNKHGQNQGYFTLYFCDYNKSDFIKVFEYAFNNQSEISGINIQCNKEQIIVHSIHKDRKYSKIILNKDNNIQSIETIILDSSEPVCISVVSNIVFIGTVSGEIFFIKDNKSYKIIQARANLISNSEIEIPDADEEFKKHFKGYFIF